MNRVVIILSVVHTCYQSICAQVTPNRDQVLDVLNTSTIPAFILMGVSSTEIARPANLREFTGSLQNATGGLSSLPTNYAVEFLINKSESVTNPEQFIGKNMSLSFGYTQDPAVVMENTSRVGAGFKIPIIKNKPKKKEHVLIEKALTNSSTWIDNIEKEKEKILEFSNRLDVLQENNFQAGIEKEKNDDAIEIAEANLFSSSDHLLKLQALAKINRGIFDVITQGLFIELSGGIVGDIPSNTISKLYTSKFGAWVTLGYERRGPFTGILIFRVLREPKNMYFDINNQIQFLESTPVDFGGRICIDAFEHKLDAGLEWVGRWRDTDVLKKSDKLLMHLAYKVGNDDKLSFSFGKDFDNHVDKSGNVISLVNFIKSIGAIEKKEE